MITWLLPLLLATASPPPPLPALPVIARVRLDINRQRVLVVYEIVMARGDWAGGDIDLWMGFGPVLPLALDARLEPVPDPTDQGEPVTIDKLTRRPSRVHPLLGSSQMAGATLHIREPAFRRATAATGVMGLRIREVLPTPAAAEDGFHEVVVRLGIEDGTPLTVRRIDLTTSEPVGWLRTAAAQLCGPTADPYVLGFASAPPGTQKTPLPIDPALATRRASDDLCVRYEAR